MKNKIFSKGINSDKTRELRYIILLIFIGLINFTTKSSFAMSTKNRPEGKGLYFYSGIEINRFLKKIGYPGFTSDIRRNLDGTALIFFQWTKKKAVVVMCNGSIKEIDLPEKSYRYSEAVLFNNDYQVIVWNSNKRTYIKDGMNEEEAFRFVSNNNPSGGYFIRPIYPSAVESKELFVGTSIHSVENPDRPLEKIMGFYGKRIFVKDNKIFVFGNGNNSDKQTELYIYERQNNGLNLIEKSIIPRPAKSPAPFYVEDINLVENEILFVDVFDLPSRSEWFVYNLNTHEMKKISKLPFFGGWGFYLQCDIIKEVTKKFDEKK